MAKDFTEGHPFKVIFLFSLPMLIGNIFQQLYSTVDSIIVGNFVGKNALAAISGSGSVQFLIVAISFGFTAGISVVLSQVYGAKEYDKLKRAFSTSLIFVLSLALLLGIIGIAISTPLLKLLGTPDDIMPDAVGYLRIMFIGMPASFLYNMCSSALRSVGDSKTPLYFLIIASIGNIVLDLLFVAVIPMGVIGAALATIIAQCLSGVLCMIYMNKKTPMFALTRKDLIYDKQIVSAIVNYGLPTAVQNSINSVSMLAVQKFVNYFGADMMAAYGITNRIESFVTMPIMNMALALSTYSGQNIGAGKVKRAKQGITATAAMQAIFCFVMAFILPVFAPNLIRLFGLAEDPHVVELGCLGISFSARFYILFGLFQVFNQFHKGAGDTKFSMVASLCMIAVRIPITYWRIYIAKLGEVSIWVGMIAGWTTSLVVNFIRFVSGGWKGKAYVQLEANEE